MLCCKQELYISIYKHTYINIINIIKTAACMYVHDLWLLCHERLEDKYNNMCLDYGKLTSGLVRCLSTA